MTSKISFNFIKFIWEDFVVREKDLEKYATVDKLVKQKKTFAEIGRFLGISRQRAHQMRHRKQK